MNTDEEVLKNIEERATEVFQNHTQAMEWLKSPQKAFGGKTPLEQAATQAGPVIDLLGRIEHGVF